MGVPETQFQEEMKFKFLSLRRGDRGWVGAATAEEISLISHPFEA